MNLQHFFAIIEARVKLMVAVFLTAIITAMIITMLLPNRYNATAKVMIDHRPSDPLSGMMFNGQLPPSYIGTQVDIIKSERVGRQVIRSTRLIDSTDFRAKWQEETGGRGNFETWAVGLISQALYVQQSRDSNVLEIGYVSQDPNFSASMANAFMQAYVDVSLEMRTEPARRYEQLFSTQAAQLRKEIEVAQAKLSAYQEENRLIETNERFDVENSRLVDLSNQLVMIQSAGFDSASREALASQNSDRMQEVLNSPVIAVLKGDIARSEARLKELQARLGDSHPTVLEVSASLREMRSRMDQEIRRVSGSVGINNSVNRARENQLRSALEAQRQKVLELKKVRDQANILQRDVENAQRAYDSLLGKRSQSALESQANQTNVSVLQNASPPVEASFPKPALNLLIACILGGGLSILCAYLLELIDPRIRVASQLPELKILAVVPGVDQDKGAHFGSLMSGVKQEQKLIANS